MNHVLEKPLCLRWLDLSCNHLERIPSDILHLPELSVSFASACIFDMCRCFAFFHCCKVHVCVGYCYATSYRILQRLQVHVSIMLMALPGYSTHLGQIKT